MQNFSTYRSFHNEDQANELIEFLKEHDISFVVADQESTLDSLYRGANPIDREVEVKIQPEDFSKVDELWKSNLEIDLGQLDPNHYIFKFTNEELYEILARPDEWSITDHQLAVAELKKRGKSVDHELIAALSNQREKDLSKEEPSQMPWIIVGYFTSLLGGVIGIVVGWVIISSKKTLPSGKQVHTYNENDRKHGKIIFYLGVFFFVVWIFIRAFEIIFG